jgi:endonuclease/exonuclease/phosphatase family metal-dependent hydrolase
MVIIISRLFRNTGTLSLLLILLFSSLLCFGQDKKSTGLPVKEESYHLKILSYNVRNCLGLDRITDYSRIADLIRRSNSEAIAIQELDSVTSRSKGIDVLSVLAEKTKMYPTYGASIAFQGGKYGVGILTREKPVSSQRISLPGREEQRSLLIVELEKIVICCTHLSLTSEDRLSSVEIINKATKKYKKPVILAGDLNAEPESEVLKSLGQDWKVLNNPLELTFPSDKPNKCIDFIMVRNENISRINLQESQVEIEKIASDHRPVWVQLGIK